MKSKEVCQIDRYWGNDLFLAQIECNGAIFMESIVRGFRYCPYCGRRIKEVER